MENPYSTDDISILSNALTLAGVEHLKKQCLDGYCYDLIFPGHKLIVEIQSKSPPHNPPKTNDQKAYEIERNLHVNELGYKIVSYSSQAVKNCAKGVVFNIQRYLLVM